MTPQRWRRISAALESILRQPVEARGKEIERLCAAEPELRADLMAIFSADTELGGPLDEHGDAGREQFLESLQLRSTQSLALHPNQPLDFQGIVRGLLAEMMRDESAGRAGRGDPGRFLPGAVLAGRYRIVALLGRGGEGEVYRADDLKLGHPVALKFIPAEMEGETGRLERLYQEVRLARQIAHPNVCRVFDVGEVAGRHFISMEYVDGEDLASLLRRIGRVPREKALQIAKQLCAGLAAAHDQSILHRDLKPANIMLDGRGRVRITDFGMAALGAEVRGRRAREGTPAYQAPEQIDGREATARSDLYALGFVLYEVFSGRRPFSGNSSSELRAEQEANEPRSLSSLVTGIDPAVDRIVLGCLQREPRLRPAAALAVMAALPGSDPLAAALAAGETPSPEMVAAAGSTGVVSPRTAAVMLGTMLLLEAMVLGLADRSSILGWIPPIKSAEVLEENAHEILRRLGYDNAPVDSTRLIGNTTFLSQYADHVGRQGGGAGRWNALRQPGEISTCFMCRQSPRLITPIGRGSQVLGLDDPPMRAGDALVTTDLRGRLMVLRVIPSYRAVPPGGDAEPDWGALLSLAGLDISRLESITPGDVPPVLADRQAAWSGVLPEFGNQPVLIRAAAYRGRPNYFQLYPKWGPPESAGAPPPGGAALRWVRNYLVPLVISMAGFAACGLAMRNWRQGRADRTGAMRLAVVIFALRMAWWVLGGHHVADAWEEVGLLMSAVSGALLAGGLVWCLYLAMEPDARQHPSFVIAWSRLLEGRLRDPMVGRDLLIGLLTGSAVFVVRNQLSVAIPELIGAAGPHPYTYPGLPWIGQPISQAMLGGRYLAAELPLALISSSSAIFTFMVLLLALRRILRFDVLALIAFVIFLAQAAPPGHPGGYTVASVVTSLLAGITWTWVVYRMGIVASIGGFLAWGLYQSFPITSDVGAPHFGIGLVGLMALLGLAAWGAWTATGARRLLRPEG